MLQDYALNSFTDIAPFLFLFFFLFFFFIPLHNDFSILALHFPAHTKAMAAPHKLSRADGLSEPCAVLWGCSHLLSRTLEHWFGDSDFPFALHLGGVCWAFSSVMPRPLFFIFILLYFYSLLHLSCNLSISTEFCFVFCFLVFCLFISFVPTSYFCWEKLYLELQH